MDYQGIKNELKVITIENDQTGILRKVAERVDLAEIPSLQKLIDDMLDTVVYIGAIGLAAPQVGVSKQLFVLDDGTVCINPSIVGSSGKITSYAEGCLSVDGDERYDVKRMREITIKCFDRNGKLQTLKPRKKLINIAIQHEIDHLHGKLICDRGRHRK